MPTARAIAQGELSGTELSQVTDALFSAGGVVTAKYGVGVRGLLPQEDEESAACKILAQSELS